MKLSYTITQNEQYANLREVLKIQFQLSDRLLLKLKRAGKILVNSVVSPMHTLVKPNDHIEIVIDFQEDNSNIPATKMDLSILYEDDAYLVVDKPAGMPVHPSMDHYEDSFSSGIKYYFDSIGLHKKIRPVNRIDKDTSGIVIFAKNEYIQECLVRQMKLHTFEKEYIAICDGILKEKYGTICAPIARKENSIIERCIHADGDKAVTHYEVLHEIITDTFSYSILKCKLETGRTHQIRVHLQHIGHPLLGDTLYGTTSPLIKRQALHAYKVHFIHPITKLQVNYVAPLPNDIQELSKATQ